MTNSTVKDRYGIDSISYMKSQNRNRMIVWVVVLLVCILLIRMIPMWYMEENNAESVNSFYQKIVEEGLYIGLLAILWWFLTTSRYEFCFGLHNYFERHSFAGALLFDVLAFLGLLFFIFGEGNRIHTDNNRYYFLRCPLILPAIFVCLMYIAPPINIQEVLLPKKILRFVVVALTVLLIIYALVTDFQL